ncbi:MAG TPA: Crp/Fnr family transcriptional regulator [Terriglobales bacterium]
MRTSATSARWPRECVRQVLCRTLLFAGLTSSELDSVSQRVSAFGFAPGQVVFMAGEEAPGIFVVASGAVRSVRQTSSGREQVLSVEYPYSTVGEVPVLDRGQCFSTVVAQCQTELLFISKEDVHHLIGSYPGLLRRTVEVLSGRVREYAELVHTLSLREVDRRVAWFLLHEATQRGVVTDAGIAVELTVTHQEIACCVGSVREMVTRAIGHLQKAGLISLRGRLLVVPSEMDLLSYIST